MCLFSFALWIIAFFFLNKLGKEIMPVLPKAEFKFYELIY